MSKKWRNHDIFYIFLLEKDITMKEQVNDIQLQFEAGDNKKYEVDNIWDSAVYAKELLR